MILEHVTTDRFKTTFSSYADMHCIPWAGDSPEQMESFLRNWDLFIERTAAPPMPDDQQRDLFFAHMKNPRF